MTSTRSERTRSASTPSFLARLFLHALKRVWAGRGTGWPNLLVISEHAEPDRDRSGSSESSAEPSRSEIKRWIFRIELDTELESKDEAEDLKRFIVAGEVGNAVELLMARRTASAFVERTFLTAAITGSFDGKGGKISERGRPHAQVVEDVSGTAPWRFAARCHMDVPNDMQDFPAEWDSVDKLRAGLETDAGGTARRMKKQGGNDGPVHKTRGKGVVKELLE